MTERDSMNESSFREAFLAGLGDDGLGGERDLALARHSWLVAERNPHLNLTRIVEPTAMARQHALDSLSALSMFDPETTSGSWVDVGTGAGWPGIAIAIAYPDLRVTLLDARRKKIDFLKEVVRDLGLEKRVRCHWDRFEDFAKVEGDRHDLALVRAVGPTLRLLEWCTNSWFGPLLLWKGPRLESELKEAEPLMRKRGIDVIAHEDYVLPDDDIERHLVLIGRDQ